MCGVAIDRGVDARVATGCVGADVDQVARVVERGHQIAEPAAACRLVAVGHVAHHTLTLCEHVDRRDSGSARRARARARCGRRGCCAPRRSTGSFMSSPSTSTV